MRDGASYWNDSATETGFERLAGRIEADVAIVGGGMAGVMAAAVMKDRGLNVALVEAARVGRQTTGRSTAKLTAQHRLIYQRLETDRGLDKARIYADAQQAGLDLIRRFCAEFGIDADLETRNAVVWTADEQMVGEIEAEAQTCARLDLPAHLIEADALPFGARAALGLARQAQFHPTKFVTGLAGAISDARCRMFENSRVTDWAPDRVATADGEIRARHVVMATHLPPGQIGFYYAVAAPYAEPVIVAPVDDPPPDMYINAEEPARSLRTHRARDGQLYAIAAGEAFRPGETEAQERAFSGLETWLMEHVASGPARWRWVNEDYRATDHLPFVGRSSSLRDAYLVATGFGARGLTNGAAAAIMLADLLSGRENRWLDLFDASRLGAILTAGFAQENFKTAKHLVGDRLSAKLHDFEALEPGQAGVLKVDGETVAAYRERGGKLHAVSALCTHMGCLVGWNPTDRTWDCPCHGSRFGIDGDVIHGPAITPLDGAAIAWEP